MFFRPGFEPLGLVGLRLHLSDCAKVVGIGIGVGKVCVGRTSIGPADTETVRDFDVDFALVAGGCRLNVVSTTSSSNFLRFIVREELDIN